MYTNVCDATNLWVIFSFSEAKKCSNGGRALMQLDFTQFLSKFEKISQLRPMPHKEYVENYVKAYYLPDVELEKWIREHNVSETPFRIAHKLIYVCFFATGILFEASVRIGQLRLSEQQENQTTSVTSDRRDGEIIAEIASRFSSNSLAGLARSKR